MPNARHLLLAVACLAVSVPAAGQRSTSLRLMSSPVIIENIEVSRSGSSVEFSFRYQNIRRDTIQAVQFGLVSIGAFGEPVGFGTVTEVGELAPYNPTRDEGEGSYSLLALGAERHYTGVAYARKVRFKGGEVWTAPKDSVQERLSRVVKTEGFSLPEDTTAVQREPGAKI